MLATLSQLIFVEAVRNYIEKLPEGSRGWLAALRDPKVGRALALMHRYVERPWTADSLAREVHLSRSTFTERFTQWVGKPPMSYLTDWRMQLAAQRLTSERVSVLAIPMPSAMNLKPLSRVRSGRAFGKSPAQWQARRPTSSSRARPRAST